MRTAKELLIAFDKSTVREPIILKAEEVDLLTQALRSRNKHGSTGRPVGIINDIQPYRNTIDGKPIGGRRQHREFLKQHGCVEIGNDFNNAKSPKEVRGDFNVRPELSRAVHQVLNK